MHDTEKKKRIKRTRDQLKKILEETNLPLERIVSDVNINFNITAASGVTHGISLTDQQKADVIAQELSDSGIDEFTKHLIDIWEKGCMYCDRRYRLTETRMRRLKRTISGDQSPVTQQKLLLKVDMCGSSIFIKKYPQRMQAIVNDIKKVCNTLCKKNDGVQLMWEGDGGIFCFTTVRDAISNQVNIYTNAVLSAVKILHWLCEYNTFDNDLDDDLNLKLIMDCIDAPSRMDTKDIHPNEYVRLNFLEKNYTNKCTLIISNSIYHKLDKKLASRFKQFYVGEAIFRENFYKYSISFHRE